MGRFDKLEPDDSLPEDVKSALSRLNRFDHLEIGALGAAPKPKAPAPEGGKELDVFKGESVSVIRMDGKVYSSDDAALPPELKGVFAYIDKNGVTPELLEELKRYGRKVDYRSKTTARPTADDLEFWKEVNGFKAAPEALPEETVGKLEPHLEAMAHFVNKGASLETMGETMAALVNAPARQVERYISAQIMSGRMRLSGAASSRPWESYDVILAGEAKPVFPLLCPSCGEKRTTRTVTHAYRQFDPDPRGVEGIWLAELIDFWFRAPRYVIEYPVCGDCEWLFKSAGLSQAFWPLAGGVALAAAYFASAGAGLLVLGLAGGLRMMWAVFYVNRVSREGVSFRIRSRQYARLFALANAAWDRRLPQDRPKADLASIAGLLFWAVLIAGAGYGAYFIWNAYRVAFGAF